jgi:hypothetical protein
MVRLHTHTCAHAIRIDKSLKRLAPGTEKANFPLLHEPRLDMQAASYYSLGITKVPYTVHHGLE